MNSIMSFIDSEQEDYGLMVSVELALRQLHITGKLVGLRYLVYAIAETVKDPNRTQLITKDMYPEIAQKFGTKDTRVERAIRSAINTCWRNNSREKLNQMAGYHLEKCPTNIEFIDLVATYIRYTGHGLGPG